MNPDCMPKRWYYDEDVDDEFYLDHILKDVYQKQKYQSLYGISKDEFKKEQLAKRDWLRDAHRDLDKYYNGRKFEEWYQGNLYDTVKDDISGAGRLDPQETARQFQAGQLVRRPGRENRACVGIVVGLVQPKWAGKEVSPTFIQVMWPDGDIDEISSDDLLLCKPLPEVV